MVSPVLNESRWSGEFIVSEANGARSRQAVTILQQIYTPPQVYSQAGTVLGAVLDGTSATYAATGGNTGNFTCSAVTLAAGVIEGVYNVEFIAPTVFNVYAPGGALVGEGKTGVGFSAGGVGFTITAGGTPAVAGDSATITLAANANVGLYNALSLTAADGTQIPAGILFNTEDVSAANAKVTILAHDCEVNGSELTYPSGATATQIATINAQLATIGIIVR
jgi:hypothetical protein